MDITFYIYDFLTGTCFYFSAALCFTGLARKTAIIISGRSHGLRFPVNPVDEYAAGMSVFSRSPLYAGTVAGRDPVLAFISLIFHISVIAAPVTAGAHIILFSQAWNVMPWLFNPRIPVIFGWTGVLTGLSLLIRRSFSRHVKAVSSWRDYAAMTCVLIPLVTGLIVKEFSVYYKTVVIIHCISGHILLIAIGWTRLGHMVFFTAGRFPIPGHPVMNRV